MDSNKNTVEEEKIEDLENIEDVAETNADDETASLTEEDIAALQQENAKLKEDYLRAYADLENTKRRCAQELEKNSKYAIAAFAKDLLVVADNLHRALETAGDEHVEQFKKGVELTESELMKVFNKFGITKMEIMGEVFNPSYHQVVQEVEDKTKPAGTIIAELQTGYMINDRILREAMVVVTR